MLSLFSVRTFGVNLAVETGEDLYSRKMRSGAFILGPTHEKKRSQQLSVFCPSLTSLIATELVPNQPKAYRDEKKDGLLRTRVHHEDGYMASTPSDSLDVASMRVQGSYERIFTRSGLDFKAIMGDGGAMGGKPEFMAITPAHYRP